MQRHSLACQGQLPLRGSRQQGNPIERRLPSGL